jgi:hypothetical protein
MSQGNFFFCYDGNFMSVCSFIREEDGELKHSSMNGKLGAKNKVSIRLCRPHITFIPLSKNGITEEFPKLLWSRNSS